MELGVTTGAIRRAKLRSNCHRQQTNTQLSTGRVPFLSPTLHHLSTYEYLPHINNSVMGVDPAGTGGGVPQ